MEFTIVTRHRTDRMPETFRDLEYILLPEAFLVYMNCATPEEYTKGLVHVESHSAKCKEELQRHRYCQVQSKTIFRHPRTMKTAILSCSDQVVMTDCMIAISKVTSIEWQEDDEFCEYLALLEANLRLQRIRFRCITRGDKQQIAIPQQDLLPNVPRSMLKFFQCEFGVNVVYTVDDGSVTHRSLLIPATLLRVDPVLHSGLYSVVTLRPFAQIILASPLQQTEWNFQPDPSRPLFEQISSLHTPVELERGRKILEHAEHFVSGDVVELKAMEFLTTPKRYYDIRILKIRNTHLIVTFQSVDSPGSRSDPLPARKTERNVASGWNSRSD